jgi:hypothetical protein
MHDSLIQETLFSIMLERFYFFMRKESSVQYIVVISPDKDMTKSVIEALGGYGSFVIVEVSSGFEKVIDLISNLNITIVFIDSMLEYPMSSGVLCQELQKRNIRCIGIDPLRDSQDSCNHHFKSFSVLPKSSSHSELSRIIPLSVA